MDMNAPVPSDKLELEIAALRQRLQDAEDLQRAIMHGEVDAFVVGPDEDQKRVLLLSGAYHRYRELVEDMLQGAVTVSRTGDILFANHSFAALVGQELVDVLRSPLERFVAEADVARVQVLFDPRPGQPEIDIALVREDGDRIKVRLSPVSTAGEFSTLLVTDLTQDPDATASAIRNGEVEALVIAGEQLVMLDSSQGFYQTAVDRMQQGVAMISSDGSISYANPRLAAMLGTDSTKLVGSPLRQQVAKADQANLEAVLMARTGGSSQAEVRLRKANGEIITALLSVGTAPDGQVMCLFSDLSLQKRHEASDLRSRQFLATLAHELRNILGNMRNSVEYVKRVESLDPECRRAIEVIDRQTARMLSLVEDLRKVNPKE